MADSLLAGDTAIVTGGASGIGRAIAMSFADWGANVVIADIKRDDGERTADEIRAAGGTAAFVPTDITDEDEVSTLIETVRERYGSLDVLVNNAGGPINDERIHNVSSDAWRRTLDLNLTGTFLCTREAIRAMLADNGGRLVHVSSVNALTGVGLTSYSASKGGVLSLSRLVATQYGHRGIRSNVVCPGTVETESHTDRRKEEWDETVREQLEAQHPPGRFATPDEVADVVRFLASERSSFVNGVELAVDGGLTAGLDRDLEHALYEIEDI